MGFHLMNFELLMKYQSFNIDSLLDDDSGCNLSSKCNKDITSLKSTLHNNEDWFFVIYEWRGVLIHGK